MTIIVWKMSNKPDCWAVLNKQIPIDMYEYKCIHKCMNTNVYTNVRKHKEVCPGLKRCRNRLFTSCHSDKPGADLTIRWWRPLIHMISVTVPT